MVGSVGRLDYRVGLVDQDDDPSAPPERIGDELAQLGVRAS